MHTFGAGDKHDSEFERIGLDHSHVQIPGIGEDSSICRICHFYGFSFCVCMAQSHLQYLSSH